MRQGKKFTKQIITLRLYNGSDYSGTAENYKPGGGGGGRFLHLKAPLLEMQHFEKTKVQH